MKASAAAAVPRSPLDELEQAGSLLAGETDFGSLVSILAEQALDESRSDLAAFYLRPKPPEQRGDLRLFHRRGRFEAPDRLDAGDALVEIALECGEAVVLLERRPGPFATILLDRAMQSGVAVPLSAGSAAIGLLVVNSLQARHYDRRRLRFLESCCGLASGLLKSAHLREDLEGTLTRARELELRHARILASMTGLLLTTDESGRLRYFNRAAAERLRLGAADLGRPLAEAFGRAVDPGLLRALERAAAQGEQMLGVRGIYRLPDEEIDFALSAAPMAGPPGSGLAILIIDQSSEREPAGQARAAADRRRLVKDTFEGSLPAAVVSHLVESPHLVRLNGDRREATVLFADIHGPGDLCGGDPESLIEALNRYFSEAVAAVIRHRGFVDRPVGGAIMAVWGVPLQSVGDDARGAVAAALDIRQMAASLALGQPAAPLRIAMAMHTGPVVAGRLGGGGLMSYSVLGETVSMATRLQAAAGPDEIIITEETRHHLGKDFVLEPRRAIRVKGRSEPIPIYRVLRRAG